MELPDLDFRPTVPAALRRAAALFADRDWIVTRNERMTFAQAEAASRRVAKEMLRADISKGTRVGLHFANGPAWLIGWLAATRIGAIAVPFSTAYKPAELRKSLRHADVHTLIVPPSLIGHDELAFLESALPGLADAEAPFFLADAPYLRRIWVSGPVDRAWTTPIDLSIEGGDPATSAAISDEFLEKVEAEVTPADWLFMIYTSGTTAEPKGVIHTHGNYVRHSANQVRFNGQTPEQTQFAGMPWFWVGGIGLSVGNSMVAGFKVVCVERYDAAEVLDLCLVHKPSVVGMWGQLAQRFREYVASTGVDVSDVPALAPPPGVPVDPGLRHNSLGMTESLGPHSGVGPEKERILPESLRGSFGLPVPHLEHRVIDPSTGTDVPEGQEGEIIVRGYSLSHGQYKRERHEAFDDDGWLHTGDKGSLREGLVFFTGRISEMIKTSGSNVAPREVEVLLEAMPEIALAIVLGVPDPERGESVGAVVVPRTGAAIDADAIRARALEELSNYKVPRVILVMEDHELPVLGNGKPDKLTLRFMLAQTSST